MHLLSYNTCCSDKVEFIFKCLAPVIHVQCGVKSMHACNTFLKLGVFSTKGLSEPEIPPQTRPISVHHSSTFNEEFIV